MAAVRLVLMSAALLAGCIHMKPAPRKPGMKMLTRLASAEECAALDRRVVGLTIASVTSGVLGGAAGGLAPYTSNDGEKYGLAGTGAGLSAASAVMSYLASHYATRYAERCTLNLGGTP